MNTVCDIEKYINENYFEPLSYIPENSITFEINTMLYTEINLYSETNTDFSFNPPLSNHYDYNHLLNYRLPNLYNPDFVNILAIMGHPYYYNYYFQTLNALIVDNQIVHNQINTGRLLLKAVIYSRKLRSLKLLELNIIKGLFNIIVVIPYNITINKKIIIKEKNIYTSIQKTSPPILKNN